jgi:hypothetical protein
MARALPPEIGHAAIGKWEAFLAFDTQFANAFQALDAGELRFRFVQLPENNFEICGRDRFGQTCCGSVRVCKRHAMTRLARCHYDNGQVMPARFQRAKQCDCMTIAPIDDGKVELGAPSAPHCQSMIDIVRNQNFGAAFFQRLGHYLFKVGVVCEQESKLNVHGESFGVECFTNELSTIRLRPFSAAIVNYHPFLGACLAKNQRREPTIWNCSTTFLVASYFFCGRRSVPFKCPRNSVGDWPKTRLNMRLNWVSDWKPTS